MKKGIGFKIAVIVFAAVFVISGYNIAKILIEDAAAQKLYSNIEKEYVTPITPAPEKEEAKNEEQAVIEVKEPAIKVDFEALTKKNNEVVGWLYLPNSVVNYPVAKAQSNDKYLRRGLDGKYLRAGTLFADFRNKDLTDSSNYIIYGHNMKNGTMFKTIVDYKKQEFYDKNPIIYYLTPEKNYKIELISGNIVKSDAEIYNPDTEKSELFEIVKGYVKTSTFKSSVTLTEEDKLITLSTCSYEYDDARFIVIGKLTEITEE